MHLKNVVTSAVSRVLGTAAALFLVGLPLEAQNLSRPVFSNHLTEVSSTEAANSPTVAAAAAATLTRPSSLLVPRETPSAMLTPAQKAVRDADRHFQYGKFCLQEGKKDEARKEFDRAVDILLDVPADAADRSLAERKFEDLIRLIHRYDVEGLDAGVASDSPVYTQSPLEGILDLTFPVDPRQKGTTLSRVQASASQLPLAVNDAVLSYINYFTSERGSRTLLAGLRRSGRYRDMVHRIFAEEGVPKELIHLAQAESGFQPMAVSRKAAVGMWQFVAFTGAQYGLTRTPIYDLRLDPEMATRAAARHLRDLYTQTGDWYLAMAGYNCGPYCVERAVQRTGYADFWELRRRSALPRETMNYVPAILAMAIVSQNLSYYGLSAPDLEPAVEWDTYRATAQTNLALVADAADVPVSIVKELNPSLIKGIAPAGFEIKIPKDKQASVSSAVEVVPAEHRGSWRLHRVNGGDTLASIARQYSTAAKSIMGANSRLSESFFESPSDGEVLLIPVSARPAKKVGSKTTRSKVSSSRTASQSRASASRHASVKTAKRRTTSR